MCGVCERRGISSLSQWATMRWKVQVYVWINGDDESVLVYSSALWVVNMVSDKQKKVLGFLKARSGRRDRDNTSSKNR